MKYVDPAIDTATESAAMNDAALRTPERSHGSTARRRVARALLENGASTVSGLAGLLGITPTAVRRHIDALVDEGLVRAQPLRAVGPRTRGRPPKVFVLTDTGRDAFEAAYDDLAASALRFLADNGGEALVAEFARQRVGDLEARYRPLVDSSTDRAAALAQALTADGYAASAQLVPGGGAQLCQHHCPVAHVAEQFPQLCEAEAEVFGRLLGTHVQRLATIAHGDGICTTHVPAAAMSTRGTTRTTRTTTENAPKSGRTHP